MKDKLIVIIFSACFFALSITAWVKPSKDISDTELRKLAKKPQISIESIMSGKYTKDFEAYSLDQFPLRDELRALKAYTYLSIYQRKDNNGIFLNNGYVSKLEYPYKKESIDYALSRFNYVYESFIKEGGSKVYVTVVPDKSLFLAEDSQVLCMDYEELFKDVKVGMDYAEYIDIAPLLNVNMYYKTDPHWDNSSLKPVADYILKEMGGEGNNTYIKGSAFEKDFKGVYFGQAGVKLSSEEFNVLWPERCEDIKVMDLQNQKEIPMYDFEKLDSRSEYDVFLGGPLSLVTIENSKAKGDRELIIIRDSFASALAPLFTPEYKKITLVDIRYLNGSQLGNYVDFNGQDVLFLYSTSVLNNSSTIK